MEYSSPDDYRLSQDAIKILEASPVPFALNDDQQRITYLNPAFTRVFGYDINDIPTLADWWPKAYPDEDYRRWVETAWSKNLAEAKRSNSDFEPLDLCIQCKDGSYRTAEVYAASLKGAYKGIHLVILHDITDSIQSSEEIRQAKNLLENVINSTPDLIYVKNTKLETVLCNKAYANMLGKCSEAIDDEAEEQLSGEEDKSAIGGFKIHKPHHQIQIKGKAQVFDIDKYPLRDVENKIIGMLGICRDITERERIESDLQKAEQRLRLAAEVAEIGIWEWRPDSGTVYWDDNMFRLYGVEPNKNGIVDYSVWADAVLPEELDNQEEIIQNTLRQRGSSEREFHIRRQNDRQIRIIQAVETVRLDAEGNVECVVGINRDVTEARKAEEKMRITQKMDALGKLTGGIAHDFNNMLGVILGYAELLEQSLAGDEAGSRHIREIIAAGNRARKLTSNLLTFSRRGPTEAVPSIINTQILNDQHMLEKVLTAQIQLELDLADDLWPCLIDSELLGDAVLNMSINAMHAMPEGGKLAISTRNCLMKPSDTRVLSIEPGEYVQLRIADTGIGMDEETRQKIFEPFFSTKGELGTGLGLSQVYGLIKQAHGDIYVESYPGHGTRISIYLPRHRDYGQVDETANTKASAFENLQGQESILIIDDEPALRELFREILEYNGYRVYVADDGLRGLQLLKSHHVDLVICDIIMPDMSGFDLVNSVRQQYPDMKIQMISGYSDDHFVSDSNRQLHRDRLQKPCTAVDLLQKVKQHFS